MERIGAKASFFDLVKQYIWAHWVSPPCAPVQGAKTVETQNWATILQTHVPPLNFSGQAEWQRIHGSHSHQPHQPAAKPHINDGSYSQAPKRSVPSSSSLSPKARRSKQTRRMSQFDWCNEEFRYRSCLLVVHVFVHLPKCFQRETKRGLVFLSCLILPKPRNMTGPYVCYCFKGMRGCCCFLSSRSAAAASGVCWLVFLKE